jgi:hypothetical protein
MARDEGFYLGAAPQHATAAYDLVSQGKGMSLGVNPDAPRVSGNELSGWKWRRRSTIGHVLFSNLMPSRIWRHPSARVPDGEGR